MAISTIVKEGAFDADVRNAINGNFTAMQATQAVTQTLTGSALGTTTHQDQLLSQATLSPTTTVTAANGFNAIRGELDVASGKTLGDGTPSFFTAVYGRANIHGTVNIASGDLAAVYGKFDLASSTLTSGHIAPVQSNIVNPPATANDAGVALFYGESASGTPIGTGIELFMAADYFMKLTNVSSSGFVAAAAGATAGGTLKQLKVSIDGADFLILAAQTYS